MPATLLALPLLLLSLQDGPVAPTPLPLPPGQIVDSVVCLRNPAQTYALYLPAGYRPDRPWPILYAFDPSARGRLPVELYREAAERYGYVVVGSNNSTNGPAQPALEAVDAVWVDTHARLAIDPRRVYTTGMSAGTVPALGLGTQKAAAIVACAGPLDATLLGPGTTGIDWLGIAGIGDFNYARNKFMVHELASREVVARFLTFEGGHGWPPAEIVARAVEWLQLAAMRKGTLAADAAFIDGYRERGVARASEAVQTGRLDDAAEEYAALSRELRGLREVADLQSEARRLHDTREAEDERKSEAELDRMGHEKIEELFSLVRALQAPPTSESGDTVLAARYDLRHGLEKLRRDLESRDAGSRIVARRVLDGFRTAVLYDGTEQRTHGNLREARAAFEACVEAQPENSLCRYELARACAALRDKKAAIAELRQAVKDGFRDKERIANDEEWEQLREDPELLAILKELD